MWALLVRRDQFVIYFHLWIPKPVYSGFINPHFLQVYDNDFPLKKQKTGNAPAATLPSKAQYTDPYDV